ncbi:AzlC family ABC transporter permease [Marinilactibacillus sp. Marseille-P9653]|uniref:AzlC family ABC transporter permease n=1 Tax=Marinilactibacillus sp. Marseille-P9653 TaxID=2866583 RepID=UPI001CE4A636|nr:AzlC family ABC transporter permease [Marinilactibacillus sp. Marseille-P9653]
MYLTEMESALKASAPIMITYVALGMACGIVLYDAGISILGISFMSVLVYAGAGQFLAASMLVLGASIPSVIVMVFFLNLRHILMSASMSTYVKERSLGFIALFSHVLTDESYGINYTKFREGNWSPEEAMVTSIANYSTWVISTIIGGVIGSQIQVNTIIMNYALIAMFLYMMVQQFVSKEHLIAGISSIVLTVILTIVLKHNIALVIATVIASFIGYYLEVRKNRHTKPDIKGSEAIE